MVLVVMEITEGKGFKKDRLAIKASNDEKEQLWGIIAIESSSGDNQKEAIVKAFEDWNMIENLCLMSYYTTADNTFKTCIDKYILMGADFNK